MTHTTHQPKCAIDESYFKYKKCDCKTLPKNAANLKFAISNWLKAC